MYTNLVIVESPAKAKTIEKFLGKDFKVLSSYGHIRDLSKKDMGIDLENNYTPTYEIPEDKQKVVSELKKAVKQVNTVWLASDEDREGEAISWHLYEALKLKPDNTKRIAFHEITKDAILHAVENPRNINIDLVNAQQARRLLDRIVGFELSPILWRKVKPALSAGRVQSVAVRLIVEREREINGFTSEASYRVVAVFTNSKSQEVRTELNKRLKTKEEALAFLEKLKSASFSVESVEVKPTQKSPAPPFTTSTLQQEASRKLGFSVGTTMSIAQRLYESGKITYMRTDSVNLSSLAINAAKAEIESAYGKEYAKTRQFNTKTKGAQEAHEAIRPTYMKEHSVSGSAQEKKLYELIWKRAVASQMAEAKLEKTIVTITISNDSLKFVAEGEVIKFDGFLRVYLEDTDDEHTEESAGLLPVIKEKEQMGLHEVTATERFTQRPPRYTEASLVRKMEELGIGRPSTYAPTISTIQNRQYIEKSNLEGTQRNYNVLALRGNKITDTDKTEITGADKNKLIPTDTGIVVNDFLTQYFPSILDYNFTATVEKEFDEIAEGNQDWIKTIDRFYKFFHPVVEEAINTRTDHKVGERMLGNDPKTGKPVSVKIGRFGPMAQIGSQDDGEKPQFAGLNKEQSITTITLEEALKLFDLPRTIGVYEGIDVSAAVGRFGPYIKYGSLFVSLPKGYDPHSVTLDQAVPLIEDKIKKDSERVINSFGANGEMQVLNGRFGPYIAYKGNNYKIPKGKDAKTLTHSDCVDFIKKQGEKPEKVKGSKKADAKPDKKSTKTTKTAKAAPKKASSTTKKKTS